LEKHGADIVIEDPDDLPDLIENFDERVAAPTT
jgi:phosphoglycolate phosphatase-like HAD superfamily hydrolase